MKTQIGNTCQAFHIQFVGLCVCMEPGGYELGVSEHLKSEEIMVKNIKYT